MGKVTAVKAGEVIKVKGGEILEMAKRIIKFRLATNSITKEPMVEVWRDDIFVASIYGHEEGVQLVSKYFDGVEHKPDYPPGVVLKLSDEEVNDTR